MISVIVPIYNGAGTLKQCLDSLLKQTYKDYEVLLVDNNSTDTTAALCRQYCRRHANFTYQLCTRQGVSAARNTGIDKAIGDYLFFLDADDFLLPDAFRIMMMTARRYHADMVIPGFYHVRRRKGRLFRHRRVTVPSAVLCGGVKIAASFAAYLGNYIYFFPFKLYKHSLLTEHGLRFREELTLGEDVLFNIAVFRKARCVALIAGPMFGYVHGNGLNTGFRRDMLSLKEALTGEIIAYLKEYHVYNHAARQQLLTVMVNDLFLCVQGICRTFGHCRLVCIRQLQQVLDSDYARKALAITDHRALPPVKKLFLQLLRLRSGELLYALLTPFVSTKTIT